MEVLYSYCEKGKGEYNEDVVVANSNIACVVDGATDVFFDKHPELGNIVSQYVNELVKMIIICFDPDKTLQDIIKLAIDNVYCQLSSKYRLCDYNEYELPTFSIVCIKENKDCYEYLVLGDCFLIIKSDRGFKTVEDKRINVFSKHNREEMKRREIDPRVDISSLDIYRSTRKMANRKDGYPIGSVGGIGIKNAVCGIVNKNDVDNLLLFSDGFIDYFKDNKVDFEQLFDAKILENIVDESSNYYENNETYMEQLRPKQIDDRTIILLKK